MARWSAVVAGVAVLLAVELQKADASDPPLALGEVSVLDAGAQNVDAGALRSMAEQAVQSMDASAIPSGAHLVLSVSLVRLESRSTPSAEVSCLISATLRERARGAVFAVVEGSARGQDDPRRLPSLQRAIVRAAVGSAVSRVPEAVRRRRRRRD